MTKRPHLARLEPKIAKAINKTASSSYQEAKNTLEQQEQFQNNQKSNWLQEKMIDLQKYQLDHLELESEIEVEAFSHSLLGYRRFQKNQNERLHGRISFNKATYQLEVIGYFNWFSLIFPFMMIIFLLLFAPLAFIAFPIFVFTSIKSQRTMHQQIVESVQLFFNAYLTNASEIESEYTFSDAP